MGRNKKTEKVVKTHSVKTQIYIQGNKCDECGMLKGKVKIAECPKCHSLACASCLKKNNYSCYSCGHNLRG